MLEEEIVKKLLEKQYTVTTAESCTGGLLAGRILNVPGASSVYNEGHITYSNEAKERLLGVSHETLVRYGAVSRQTAEEMARGAAKTAKELRAREAGQKKSRLVLSMWDVVLAQRPMSKNVVFMEQEKKTEMRLWKRR